jgi:hypothetical protein
MEGFGFGSKYPYKIVTGPDPALRIQNTIFGLEIWSGRSLDAYGKLRSKANCKDNYQIIVNIARDRARRICTDRGVKKQSHDRASIVSQCGENPS